jgi:hypothetical protein
VYINRTMNSESAHKMKAHKKRSLSPLLSSPLLSFASSAHHQQCRKSNFALKSLDLKLFFFFSFMLI